MWINFKFYVEIFEILSFLTYLFHEIVFYEWIMYNNLSLKFKSQLLNVFNITAINNGLLSVLHLYSIKTGINLPFPLLIDQYT